MTFNGKIYIKSKRINSYGQLGHDLIKAYANNATETFNDFKTMLQNEKWGSPWIDEIVVEESLPQSEYNPEHFFKEDAQIVMWPDGTKFYVARYWLTDDIRRLAQLLHLELE